MKITDKIVTSKILPTLTNVVWHNPETGELKMFGEKGWETVGGMTGVLNGYPMINIEEASNVTISPNIYYNIKSISEQGIYVSLKKDSSMEEVVSEYIILIPSPANVFFTDTILWDNNFEPDFDIKGIYTVSILNGVGCFTFVAL